MKYPILLMDGYKVDHRRQYPDGTEYVYSNFTPRSSRLDVDSVVFVGLQYFLEKYLMSDFGSKFFDRPKAKVLEHYRRRIDGYLGPNQIDLDHIEALWDLSYIPLEFKAWPEGSSVPLGVPMLTVQNTHPDFAWLVNYIETLLSSVLWLPCTSATSARELRKLLDMWAAFTGSPAEFVPWQGHDFSFRGMGSPEAAATSGLGHLVYFDGTDTLPAVDLIDDYYLNASDPSIGGSVAATEHSVMCAGGAEDEMITFQRILNLYPSGIVSVVSDTWDLWNVLNTILPALKDQILARDGKLVIRPDSGDPVKIICGDPDSFDYNARKGVVELLWDEFGGTTTETGFKVLDSHVGVIYGDSITYERADAILHGLAKKGFASANMVFGVGSYTYQYVTRDTHGFAMKATWAQINGEGIDMFKDPKTDNSNKKSAKGRLAVLRNDDDTIYLQNQATPEQEEKSILQTVWKDGDFVVWNNFSDVRRNAGV